jgi:hypothetical protein
VGEAGPTRARRPALITRRFDARRQGAVLVGSALRAQQGPAVGTPERSHRNGRVVNGCQRLFPLGIRGDFERATRVHEGKVGRLTDARDRFEDHCWLVGVLSVRRRHCVDVASTWVGADAVPVPGNLRQET